MAHLVKLLNAGDQKKEVRRILKDNGFELTERTYAVHYTPINLKTFESYSDAEELAAQLKAAGAEIEIVGWNDKEEDEVTNNFDTSFTHQPQEQMFATELQCRIKDVNEDYHFIFMRNGKIYVVSCISITKKCKELLSSPEFIQEDSAYDTLEQLFKSKMQHLTTMYTLTIKSENKKTEICENNYFSVVIMEIPEIHNTTEKILALSSICKVAHTTILEYTTSLDKLEHLEKDLNGTLAESD